MTSENIEYSNQIPIWKFAFLSVITFGIYEIYWMYKHWQFFKIRNGLKIRPFWRSVFGLLFIYSLFGKISKFSEEIGYEKKIDSGLLALLYLGLYYFAKLPDPFWLVSMLSFVAFIRPIQVMNFYWNNTQPDLPLKPFRWWQILLMIPLLLLSALSVIIAFLPGV